MPSLINKEGFWFIVNWQGKVKKQKFLTEDSARASHRWKSLSKFEVLCKNGYKSPGGFKKGFDENRHVPAANPKPELTNKQGQTKLEWKVARKKQLSGYRDE